MLRVLNLSKIEDVTIDAISDQEFSEVTDILLVLTVSFSVFFYVLIFNLSLCSTFSYSPYIPFLGWWEGD